MLIYYNNNKLKEWKPINNYPQYKRYCLVSGQHTEKNEKEKYKFQNEGRINRIRRISRIHFHVLNQNN